MSSSSPWLGIITVLVLVQLFPAPASGEAADDISIEFDPHEVVLQPGEETRVTLTVSNQGVETKGLAFAFVPVDAPRHSEGSFSAVYMSVGPGESRKSVLTVRSNARTGDEEDVSDFVVIVQWGTDLELDDDGDVVESTVEGSWEHEFHVVYEAEPGLRYLSLAIVVGMAVMLSVLILWPGWAGGRGAT